MPETTEKTGEKKLSVSSTKTLTLKGRGVEQGVVRQSFSHGRTKAVVVEKVKTRALGKPRAETATPVAAPAQRSATAKPATAKAPAPAAAPAATPAPAVSKPSGVVLRTLTEEERVARAHALADSRLREAEERKIAEEDARIREARDAIERVEREAAEARKREEDDRRKHDEETKRKADDVAKKRFGGEAEAAKPRLTPAAVGARAITLEPEEEESAARPRRPGVAARPAAAPKPARGVPDKRRARLTVTTADRADEVREHSKASFARRIKRRMKDFGSETKEKLVREVTIPEFITIQELSNRMAEPARTVMAMLMKQGQMLKITDTIDADTAQLLTEELGHTVKRVAESDVEEGLFDAADDEAALGAAPAGRDHHGPRRPRQDLAARRHPLDRCGGGRSRRHHPAYRRLSGDLAVARQDHLHRHARPRRFHRDARARRQGDRHRGAGGGRR